MAKIAHYIITRFNLRSDASSVRAIDPAWLDRRFALFDQFCLPTIKSQTLLDFRWLLLFDSETPPSARRRIEELAQWKNISVIFMEAGAEDVGRAAVLMAMQEPPDILLTTRLDNDDGLASDYVETIRRFCDVSERTVLEFPVGYVWWEGRAYRDRQLRNPFVTLVEPLHTDSAPTFSTVYRGAHHESYKLGHVVEVSQEPGWLQVVHGGNLANRQRGVREPVSSLRGRFALDDALLAGKESAMGLALDAIRTRIVEEARRVWHRVK